VADAGLRRRRRLTRLALYALMVVVAVVAIFPLYWLVISSVKGPQEFGATPPTWFPRQPTADGFRTALEQVPFPRALANSVIITGTATLSVLVTSTLAGYVFAKYRFRGRDALFWSLVATMFIPPVVTLVPLYHLISSMGLVDSFVGVVLPWLANAFGIFLVRQFMLDVPDELIEAARVDGAGELRIVVRILAPLLKPALITLAVFCIVYYWNNFIWPLTALHSNEQFPLVLQLNGLMSFNTSVQYRNVVLAGAILASLPTIAIFLAAQRVFVQGIARAGIR
jgi:multiple sugar transport system permease protein